jgi:hypothetical protein
MFAEGTVSFEVLNDGNLYCLFNVEIVTNSTGLKWQHIRDMTVDETETLKLIL